MECSGGKKFWWGSRILFCLWKSGENVEESGVRYRTLHGKVENSLREGVLPGLRAPLPTI